MNENLGINMSSYLEWNILLAVLALFGNFPYGPPLSPNGIWDSFVSPSVSLAHINNTRLFTLLEIFLCNGCIGECVCGNWGLGKKKRKKFDSLWRAQTRLLTTHHHQRAHDSHIKIELGSCFSSRKNITAVC